jgi:hypothetical protein
MGNLKIFVYTAPMETLISADVAESRYEVQSLEEFLIAASQQFSESH